VLGVKLWHDGSPYTGSMFTGTPYLDSPLARTLGIRPGSHGEAMIAEDKLAGKIRHHGRAGWQVAIHSQGDASNREVLEAVERRWPAEPAPRRPCAWSTACCCRATAWRRLARLGVSPSFHIHHIRYYGDALADAIVGTQAAMQSLPVLAAFEEGTQPTLHADSPMFPPDAFALMQTAIDRRTRHGQVAQPHAGHRHPAGGARNDDQRRLPAAACERHAGSLEPGKWADLQIVDRNPYDTPVEALDRIRTRAVWVGGDQKYRAGDDRR
jgi:predicted amidohydrolase YtcJ